MDTRRCKVNCWFEYLIVQCFEAIFVKMPSNIINVIQIILFSSDVLEGFLVNFQSVIFALLMNYFSLEVLFKFSFYY